MKDRDEETLENEREIALKAQERKKTRNNMRACESRVVIQDASNMGKAYVWMMSVQERYQ